MKTYKRVAFSTLLIAALAVIMVGCGQKKDKRGSIRSGREARGEAAGTGITPPGGGTAGTNQKFEPVFGKYWGEITRGNLSLNEFDRRVKLLTSATIPSIGPNSEVGFVSGDANQDTGVRFWGNVQTTSNFNPGGGNNGAITVNLSTSELRIVIWDSFTGQTDANGQKIEEIPIHIHGMSSANITGNQAVLVFEDQYGRIELHGNFDANVFSGWVYFDNAVYWDGGEKKDPSGRGAAQWLGQFAVKTCGFFTCK